MDIPGERVPGQQNMPNEKIGKQQVNKATEILKKYKAGKANLEKRVISDQQWWKLRNNTVEMPKGQPGAINAPSAWLWNVVLGKHADAMAAYPTFNCLPREEGDRPEAQALSSIIPLVLEQNDFEEVYSEISWQKMIEGTGVFGVFWDRDKLNGLGDISIRKVSILNMFWEPGISDIQDSSNVFVTQLVDDEILKQMYPELQDVQANKLLTVSEYIYDDSIDKTNKSLVIDWYYRKWDGPKKTLHYVKYVGEQVLFATENDPEMAVRGLYDDGDYPFVLDRLFPVEGSICGYGYIDIGKAPQEVIDQLNMAITTNAVQAVTPRYFVRSDSSINEDEFRDWTRPFVHTDGNLGTDSIQPIQTTQLNGNYLNVLVNKIDELKMTSGNQDIQNGAGISGVTAASAIAALQEAAGRSSKDSSQSAYRAYARLISMVIERIRQFYDVPRKFRITGQMGQEDYISYDNRGLVPQNYGMEFGVDMGYRLPVFDIKVSAQKANAYTKMSQNELALQFFQLGFFNPQLTDQALMTLEIMDFDGKEQIMQKVAQYGTMAQKLAQYQQMALMLAAKYEPAIAEGLAADINGTGAAPMARGSGEEINVPEGDAMSANGEQAESGILQKARARAQQSSQPNE